MEREHVEERIEPILVKLEEAHQHERACEQVGDVEGQTAHHSPRETNRRSVANRPSISAAPKNSGTRNTRILAIDVSNSASRKPPIASLPMYAAIALASAAGPAPGGAKPHGTNTQAISDT